MADRSYLSLPAPRPDCAIVYWMIWFARDAAKFFWFLFYFFLTLSYFTFFGVMNTCLTVSMVTAGA